MLCERKTTCMLYINKRQKINEGAIKTKQPRETGNTGCARRRKTKQEHNTIGVGHHYAQTNINDVNKI